MSLRGQYAITAWFVGAASLQLIIGPLSDRVGRRFVLLASGLIFMLASLFASLSTYYWLFICMRCCQGFAVAAIAIAGYGMIFEVMERREAAITVAWMSALTVIAPAAGPLLGALWLNYFDWRLSFVMLTLLAALPVFGFALLLPKTSTSRTKFSLTEIVYQYARVLSCRAYMINAISYCCLFAGLTCWIVEAPFLTMIYLHKSLLEYAISQAIIFVAFALGNLFDA